MYEAIRDIMPGDNLRRSAVKMAPSVRKNEEIEIFLVRGALTVTNVVRVSRDATIGETIDVVNVESGRILKARVVGIGQVELL
jgi:flagella basal body P-ring formation protein FlgA